MCTHLVLDASVDQIGTHGFECRINLTSREIFGAAVLAERRHTMILERVGNPLIPQVPARSIVSTE